MIFRRCSPVFVRRSALLLAVAALGCFAVPDVATAKGVTQIAGTAKPNAVALCGDRGAFPAIEMRGSLVGCWYTDSLQGTFHPSGTYQETGTETFVGCLADGLTCGSFSTTYHFNGKFAPSGAEIHGRCEHPITEGTGTDGFAGVRGRVDFKDDVVTGCLYYRGHFTIP